MDDQTPPNMVDTREGFFAEVDRLAVTEVTGEESRVHLDLRVVDAAHKGLLNTTKDTDGTDDGHRIHDHWVAAGSARRQHTATGRKVNASEYRKLIQLGNMTIVDGPMLADACLQHRKKLIKDEIKVVSAHDALVGIAREQIKITREITPEVIDACCRPKVKDAKTVEEVVLAAKKEIEKLVLGKRSDGVIPSEEETAAILPSVEALDATIASLHFLA